MTFCHRETLHKPLKGRVDLHLQSEAGPLADGSLGIHRVVILLCVCGGGGWRVLLCEEELRPVTLSDLFSPFSMLRGCQFL